MQIVHRLILFLIISISLSSCEFSCNMGSKQPGKEKGKAILKGGAALYNGIELQANGVEIDMAYLIFENGERVPDGNFVDFESPIKIVVFVKKGWTVQNGKAKLGASEKVITKGGKEILNEPDLFRNNTDGFTEEDAKVIALTTTLRVPANTPPTWFETSFRIWDKQGNGVIEGKYRLYSK